MRLINFARAVFLNTIQYFINDLFRMGWMIIRPILFLYLAWLVLNISNLLILR